MKNKISPLIVNDKPSIAWVDSIQLLDRLDSYTFKSYILKNDIFFSDLENTRDLGEVLQENNRGKGIPQSESGHIPNLKVRNLTNFGIDIEDVDVISQEEFDKNTKAQIKKGDVLLAVTGVGSLGKVDLYWSDEPATVDGHVCILRTNDKCDNGYLKAYLQSKYGQIFIEKYTIGSTGQTELYSKDIERFKIPLPNFQFQKHIGDKVRTAEQLRSEAKLLKEEAEKILAQELQVKDRKLLFRGHAGKLETNSNKRTYKSVPAKYILERLNANSYHPELIDTLEYINHRFKLEKLESVLEYYDTGLSQLSYAEKGVSIVSTGTIKNEFLGKIEKYTSDIVSDEKMLRSEDVLLTMYGATSIGKVDIFHKELTTTTFDYTLFRMKYKKEYPPYYMSLLLRTDLIQIQIKYAINSGGGTNFLSRQSILDLQVPVINLEHREKVNELMKKANENMIESSRLIISAKDDVEAIVRGNLNLE
ncbi:type I restriction enzyme, S subunit [Cytobacillus horneckiae]|uniref:restriction endonuclease subunit S n=1 Tax=Cytobacillus horneckiae TaxID=549687 RepID=UPI0019D29CF3|nr:restriction endonuclease subunit S [Cytobacillus horneckiae]MBN6889611.1 restriction endonuclease subunit S [Cytobacillus horneckiae]MCM3180917.1 restriction endonuclease subunit S [Cytobacillus horneckiae]